MPPAGGPPTGPPGGFPPSGPPGVPPFPSGPPVGRPPPGVETLRPLPRVGAGTDEQATKESGSKENTPAGPGAPPRTPPLPPVGVKTPFGPRGVIPPLPPTAPTGAGETGRVASAVSNMEAKITSPKNGGSSTKPATVSPPRCSPPRSSLEDEESRLDLRLGRLENHMQALLAKMDLVVGRAPDVKTDAATSKPAPLVPAGKGSIF
eukprot:gnl/TRDRNA2_/TRDRNA2_172317_c2_seq1.p1 gnl/TRDRNA2_/TRDRNA2_172317_c2~~gnl/TRDRNA2_/TRDRNA2_172317_c2_seq1.p1  ORF type:complete len:221 (-),score=32.68 gnl/TRDRNA2_/TRDRNA2_172317_c2_seq1:180-797(-)